MPHFILLLTDSRLINHFRYCEGNFEKCSCVTGRCPVIQFMCLIICTKSRLLCSMAMLCMNNACCFSDEVFAWIQIICLALRFQLHSIHVENSIWNGRFFLYFIWRRTSLSSLILKHFNNWDYQLCFIGFDFCAKALSKASNNVLSAELMICFRCHFLYLSSIAIFRQCDCNNQVSIKPYLVWQILPEIVVQVFVLLIKGLIWLLAETENHYWF